MSIRNPEKENPSQDMSIFSYTNPSLSVQHSKLMKLMPVIVDMCLQQQQCQRQCCQLGLERLSVDHPDIKSSKCSEQQLGQDQVGQAAVDPENKVQQQLASKLKIRWFESTAAAEDSASLALGSSREAWKMVGCGRYVKQLSIAPQHCCHSIPACSAACLLLLVRAAACMLQQQQLLDISSAVLLLLFYYHR